MRPNGGRYIPTWYFGFVAVIGWDGTIGPTVSPFSLTSDMVTCIVHMGGTPSLVFGQMSHVPNARMVRHTVESEREYTGQVWGRTADSSAYHF